MTLISNRRGNQTCHWEDGIPVYHCPSTPSEYFSSKNKITKYKRDHGILQNKTTQKVRNFLGVHNLKT